MEDYIDDQTIRAAAAVKLLERAVREDDQASFDFLSSVIECDRLYARCSDDAGEPFATMNEFLREIEAEQNGHGTSPRCGRSTQ